MRTACEQDFLSFDRCYNNAAGEIPAALLRRESGEEYHHEERLLYVLALALSAEAVEPDDRDDYDALTDLL